MGGIRKRPRLCVFSPWRQEIDGWNGGGKYDATGAMARAAIGMKLAGVPFGIRDIGLALMLMGVMAKMLRCSSLFMLAIRTGYRPRKLERQDDEQENKEKFFHAANNSIDF